MIHLADFDLDIPVGHLTFEEFRHWTLSTGLPERGRFDFLCGRVEADTSPESLYGMLYFTNPATTSSYSSP